MEPFEIMVCESQERMLCVCEPDRLDEVLAVCEKWEVHGTAIGVVTDGGRLRVLDGDRVVGDVPVVGARRRLPALRPRAGRAVRPALRAAGGDARRGRRRARDAPGAPREPEHRLAPAALPAVRLDRAVARPCAARARPTPRCCGCPGATRSPSRSTAPVAGSPCDPYTGTIENVLECAANLACVGAEPLGLTNCLNFGNPEKSAHRVAAHREHPRPRRRLSRARRAGRRRQRLALQRGRRGPDLPDAGRRASSARCPTPRARAALAFAAEGDAVGLVGPFAPALPGSELAKLRGEALPDGLPGGGHLGRALGARRGPRGGPRGRR